ncbi:MAG: hypothetical protein ACRD9R_00815 [Pyrinomonadaceae bacterium]
MGSNPAIPINLNVMPYKDPNKKRAWQQQRNLKFNQMRAACVDVARFILWEARRADKRRGSVCNLTREQAESLIAYGCQYCGETNLRMTLDRIDNNKGHSFDNVVPAYIRCNYARRNMPYEAWLCLADGMKRARELGLFKDWTGRTR